MGGNVMGWVKGNSDQVWGLQITHSCHMHRCMFVLWLAEKKVWPIKTCVSNVCLL